MLCITQYRFKCDKFGEDSAKKILLFGHQGIFLKYISYCLTASLFNIISHFWTYLGYILLCVQNMLKIRRSFSFHLAISIFFSSIRGVLDCSNFGCFVSSRFQHLHCIAMEKLNRRRRELAQNLEIEHTPASHRTLPILLWQV